MADDIVAMRSSESVYAPEASPDLFAALYRELHELAARQIRRGGDCVPLGTTTLLHETYLNLSARERLAFPDRAHFIGYAARVMRGILVDHARRARTSKRGGDGIEITLVECLEMALRDAPGGVELERLSDALDELAALQPALAELIDLHFFCGYRLSEIADLRACSERTVQRDFRKARLLLHRTLLDER